MTYRILLAALTTAAAVSLASPTAQAQGTSNAGRVAPRVIATYDFGAKRHAIAFPATVIVADSAGTLIASARLVGEAQPRPMQVTVIESDLVLETQTKDGVLTLVLDNQAASEAPRLKDSRWSLGDAEGRLRARR